MNKKIIIGIAVGVVIIAATFGVKSIMGEKIELPAEENTEKALNLQENNQSTESNHQLENLLAMSQVLPSRQNLAHDKVSIRAKCDKLM